MKTVQWHVAGMTCEGCSTRLNKLLNAAEGVETAQVELAGKQAIIGYDPARIQPAALKNLIEDAGFEVVV
ncbi:copper-transporting atpase-like protein [Lasius niger]|uniref:Copper-transporting atpase-like protein n=1 Tax=Lasius niger TaxID=67767 RepID=A0A0J7JYR3_LASNI|nr:copper-transporting atpase-like protein [Lasius niger]